MHGCNIRQGHRNKKEVIKEIKKKEYGYGEYVEKAWRFQAFLCAI